MTKPKGAYLVSDRFRTSDPKMDNDRVIGHTTSPERALELTKRAEHEPRVEFRPDDGGDVSTFTPREYHSTDFAAAAEGRSSFDENGESDGKKFKLTAWHGLREHAGILDERKSKRKAKSAVVSGRRDEPKTKKKTARKKKTTRKKKR